MATQKNTMQSKNWEVDVDDVRLEPCGIDEDPLGYRAVFYFNAEIARAEQKKSFVIGASMLAHRERNLQGAGYRAPMTRRALAMMQGQIERA